ncbi:hypothetical protein CC86DRAFT_73065 [Ophiobolus disseminans]|uniref:Uncharacterized protein n=1 Tax=Ophiobolus disseminans TaxID=1469910 RepID=A0A6A6ZQG1_9PLEO|nr:hypothetical protein CC86DRAFT_73065 [Ophiobolus disseminans]
MSRSNWRHSTFVMIVIAPTNSGARTTNNPGSSGLTTLQNELLHQIIGYLLPIEEIQKADGYGTSAENTETGLEPDVRRRQALAARVGILLDLARSCRRLLPVVQEALYISVSLPQLRQSSVKDTRQPWPLANFLRTVIRCPDLAARVRNLAGWLWKGNAADQDRLVDREYHICGCWECLQMLNTAVKNLRLTNSDTASWMESLRRPTEAMVCSLVLAALPNLKSVSLYAKRYPGHDGTRENAKLPYTTAYRSDAEEMLCLTQGLASTRIKELTFLCHLNGLHTVHDFRASLYWRSICSAPVRLLPSAKGAFATSIR